MADLEERPSKMRKVDPLNGPNSTLVDMQVPVEDNLESSGRSIEKQKHDEEHRELSELDSEEREQNPGEGRAAGSPAINPEATTLSKNQLKKLRKKAEWAAGKEYRKQQKKTKEAAKKAKRNAEKAALLAAGLEPTPPKSRPAPSIQTPITLLLDCDFDDYMTDKELMSLGQQITRSYSDNKHAKYRAHLVISSFNKRLKERYETVLSNHHLGWKGATFSDKFFVEAAQDAHDKMVGPDGGKIAGALLRKEATRTMSENPQQPNEQASNPEAGIPAPSPKLTDDPKIPICTASGAQSQTVHTPVPSTPQIVYLSSDSEHTLDYLSPYTTYVIGGIVDKNRHKGLCFRRANELGIPTAKLPIGEYMQMQSRTVLATNHVVEIMANWLDTGDWGEAFMKAIPKRKEAVLRNNLEKQKRRHESEDEGEEEEDIQDEDE